MRAQGGPRPVSGGSADTVQRSAPRWEEMPQAQGQGQGDRAEPGNTGRGPNLSREGDALRMPACTAPATCLAGHRVGGPGECPWGSQNAWTGVDMKELPQP